MAGTKSGGLQASQTNKKLYGDDFYARIGATGGSRSGTGGFYVNRDLARIAGAKGGSRLRTHCRKENHELTPDNITIVKVGNGKTSRLCKTCYRAMLKRKYQEMKAKNRELEKQLERRIITGES